MENLDFGWGFVIMMMAIYIIVSVLKTVITVLCVYYLSKALAPTIAGVLGFTGNLTDFSKYDFLCYGLAWLIAAPVIGGVIDAIGAFASPYTSAGPMSLGLMSALNYCMLGLTIWYYSADLEVFRLKSIGKVIVQAFVFLAAGWILRLPPMILQGNSGTNTYMFTYVGSMIIYPFVYGLITIFYIKRNKKLDILSS
jgi:hypothetical protein